MLNLEKSKNGFLGIGENDATNYAASKAIIIPFGLEKTVSYGSGTKRGPQAIIRASHQVELFDEELWCEAYKKYGVSTLKQPKIKTNIHSALKQLEDIVRQVLENNKFPLILGGEHSIIAGSIRPFAEKYKDLAILHFDAHADLRNEYQGQKFSHASALRRCMDFKNIKLISAGIRNISTEEVSFLRKNRRRIKIYWAKDKSNWDIKKIISSLKNKSVYLTFDVDAFDSSIMPSTGTHEPGGLFWNETIKIIRSIAQKCKIVGADINELSPKRGFESCNFLAAKLAYKVLNYAFTYKK